MNISTSGWASRRAPGRARCSSSGTHDTKRGEDLRARLNILSEIPDAWQAAIDRWRTWNAPARSEVDGAQAPDANEEYLIYQTLVGSWPGASAIAGPGPDYLDRLEAYFLKALREAKLNTSWLNPNVAYEQAVTGFLRRIVQDNGSPFVADLDQFVRALADAGYVNGLAQTLIKICCPGVPDFYQGTEFWDFNFVDPDNRRRVDFLQRRHALASLLTPCDPPGLRAAELLTGWPDKRIKLFVLAQALRHRRERREFGTGDYVPLAAEGPRGSSRGLRPSGRQQRIAVPGAAAGPAGSGRIRTRGSGGTRRVARGTLVAGHANRVAGRRHR